MRTLKYFGFNGAFAAALVGGYGYAIEGAENLALFIAWTCIVGSALLLFASQRDEVKKALSEPATEPPVVPKWLDVLFDLIVSGVFVWFGETLVGSLYFVHIFLIASVTAEAKRYAEGGSN